MRNAVLLLAIVGVFATGSHGETTMPSGYVEPAPLKSVVHHPLPPALLDAYITALEGGYVSDVFRGMNDTLSRDDVKTHSKSERIAVGHAMDLGTGIVFTTSQSEGAFQMHVGSVSSVDAVALRLQVDLSELPSGEEVWIVDPTGPRAFGPYTAADALEGGRWLPTVEGDTAVLLARTPIGLAPALSVTGLSHFYRALDETGASKAGDSALACNVNIACEADATLQTQSTAVGLLLISDGAYSTVACSGTLLNNADTPAFEPYLLTANHCLSTLAGAEQLEVVWDYRVATCAGDTPPLLSSLPRSYGVSLLTTSSSLDMTLVRLDQVPNGALGRAYVGYTTQPLAVGQAVVGIHHPRATHMRISYGAITVLDAWDPVYRDVNRVLWSEGVTEGGSSGSPLLLASAGHILVGSLSNGELHSCTNPDNNHDDYASFRDFYAQAQGWLSGTNPPPPDGDTSSPCPAKSAFVGNPETLAQLRAFRDHVLLPHAWGRQLADAYYAVAPEAARLVESSWCVRNIFVATAVPFAMAGQMLREGEADAVPHSSMIDAALLAF